MTKMEENIRFSKDLRSYYVEQLLPLHNAVFRLAYAVTLNTKLAQKLTEFCYIDAAQQLDQLNKNADPLKNVIAALWHAFNKNKRKVAPDQSIPLTKALDYLDPEQRFMLVGCDVLGLEPADMAIIMGKDADVVTQNLIICRQQLLDKGLNALSEMA